MTLDVFRAKRLYFSAEKISGGRGTSTKGK